MKLDFKECGKRIQQLRKERGLTQEQLAEQLNVSQNTIAKIEFGLRRPFVDFLIELSEFFNISTNYLVLGVHAEEVDNKALKEDIDKAITQIDIVIKELLTRKEELIQRKKELK